MNSKKTNQEQLNKDFESSTIYERSKIAFVQVMISNFCTNAYEAISNGKGEDFLKDFTDTLMFKKKLHESEASNIAFEFLAKTYSYVKEQSEKGKKGSVSRWEKAQPTNNQTENPF